MNSKGHLFISITKLGLRIVSCILAIILKSFAPLAIGFGIAEILGVLEELVDKR